MSIAKIGKLQENTTTLCKIGCETFRVSAIRGFEYVYSEKLKCLPLPSGSWIPDVRHPDVMAAAADFRMWYIRMEWRRQQNSGCDTSWWKVASVGWNGGGSRMKWAGSHTPCILDLLMAKDFKASALHVSELYIALPWIPNNSPQSQIALVIKKLSKPQNLTQFD